MILVKQICSSEESKRYTLVKENNKIHLEINDSSDLLLITGLNMGHALCHTDVGTEDDITLELTDQSDKLEIFKIPANELCFTDEEGTKKFATIYQLTLTILEIISSYKITEEEFPFETEIDIN